MALSNTYSFVSSSKIIINQKMLSDNQITRVSSSLMNVARHTISNLKELIAFRNTSTAYADVIDNYADDVWQKIITMESLKQAGEIGFIPILTKYRDLRSKKNLFPAIVQGLKHKQQRFIDMAISLSSIRDEHIIYMASYYGNVGLVQKYLTEKPQLLNTKLKQNYGLSVANEIDFVCFYGDFYLEDQYAIDELIEDIFTVVIDDEVLDRDQSDVEAEIKELVIIFYDEAIYPDTGLLFGACRSGNIDLVRFLEEQGLDSYDENGMDFFDDTNADLSVIPLDMALISGNKEVIRYACLRTKLAHASTTFPDFVMRHIDSATLKYAERLENNIYNNVEIDEFDMGDFLMFRELAKQDDPQFFLQTITNFGNKAYYCLGVEVIVLHKDSLFRTSRNWLFPSLQQYFDLGKTDRRLFRDLIEAFSKK
jgi:hypothetical protein